MPGNVEQIATQLDSPDNTKANGTSIAFVLEYQGRRALFSADAHPNTLINGLERFSQGTERVEFAVVKVAHHGSAANSTSQLMNRLASDLWLISSNGSRHQHPDPEAVARIVLTPLRNKKLIFNYRTKFNGIWSAPELANRYEYHAVYPSIVPFVAINFP
jgi:beta-lactamase superfamily II metal-dependent hydrolase